MGSNSTGIVLLGSANLLRLMVAQANFRGNPLVGLCSWIKICHSLSS